MAPNEPTISSREITRTTQKAPAPTGRVRWSWLFWTSFGLGLIQLAVHSPVNSQVVDLAEGDSRKSLHCTSQLTAGERIDLGGAPLGCGFDPISDELYCGTAAGEIVKVDTHRSIAVQRWKVTDGKVISLSFLTHRHSTKVSAGPVHGMMAYIDTHRGLMLWDSRQHDEPPVRLPADYGTHHSSYVATAPIEGGIFYTLPCSAEYDGHVPNREEMLKLSLEARPTGKLMHVLPHLNATSELATELWFPTNIAVPFTEEYALVLEPLGYRVKKVSLEGAELGKTTGFLNNLPAFPCAIAPTDHFHLRPDFYVALCGPRRSPLLEILHRHPLLKNMLGWPFRLPTYWKRLTISWLEKIFQVPTPSGHTMIILVASDASIKEVLCDDEVHGVIPQASFILPHAGSLYIGSEDFPFLVHTNRSKHPIFPLPQHLHDEL